MSTKTTLKRIALVAVAALGMGLLSVVPAKAALNGTAAPFSADTALLTSVTSIGTIQYVVGTQTAGSGNYVPLQGNSSPQTDSVSVSVSGSSIVAAVPAKATWTYAAGTGGQCTSASGTLYGSTVTVSGGTATFSALPSGLATKYVDESTTATTANTVLLNAVANTVSALYTGCVGGGKGTLTIGAVTPAQVWVSAATAGGFTATVAQNAFDNGVATPTTKQVITFAVTAGAVYTASTVSVTATSPAYYNKYEGLYAPAGAVVGTTTAVGTIDIYQYAGGKLIGDTASGALAKAVTVSLSGVGSLASGTAGATFYGLTATDAATAATNGSGIISIPVYSDGRAGTATITVNVGGTDVSTKKVFFYGAPAKVTATLALPIGLASASGGVNGSLTWIDLANCAKGTEDECNTELDFADYPAVPGVSFSKGSAASPAYPGDLNDPAVAVLVTDANGTPVPAAVFGTSSDSTVISIPVATSLLDNGKSSYSAGTYYQHITYKTSPLGVKGKSATLTYSVLLANGTVISSAPLTVTLGGGAATVTMTADKASYAPGEAGVITVTAKDSAGFAAYDGSALFSDVKINTTLFTGSVPSTSSTTVNGTKTFKFFAPIVAGTWTITGTLNDGVTKVTLPITVKADTSAIDAAADAALQAVDAANAATEAANMAAEAADAATMAAQDAKDAADAATAAVEKLAQDVAAMIDAIKAQLKTLANIIAKIAKKVKA